MSLRRYITLDEVNELINTQYTQEQFDSIIDKAEGDVDSMLATHIQGVWSKADKRQLRYTATFTSAHEATLSGGNVVLSNDEQYLVIKVLTGSKTGLVRAITSNTGNAIEFDSIDGLTGSAQVIVYQYGKLPFEVDSDDTAKWINEEIKQAVAYQIEYLIDSKEAKKSRKGGKKKSESIGANYSYTNEDSNSVVNSGVDIAPKAQAILGKYSINLLS